MLQAMGASLSPSGSPDVFGGPLRSPGGSGGPQKEETLHRDALPWHRRVPWCWGGAMQGGGGRLEPLQRFDAVNCTPIPDKTPSGSVSCSVSPRSAVDRLGWNNEDGTYAQKPSAWQARRLQRLQGPTEQQKTPFQGAIPTPSCAAGQLSITCTAGQDQQSSAQHCPAAFYAL